MATLADLTQADGEIIRDQIHDEVMRRAADPDRDFNAEIRPLMIEYHEYARRFGYPPEHTHDDL